MKKKGALMVTSPPNSDHGVMQSIEKLDYAQEPLF